MVHHLHERHADDYKLCSQGNTFPTVIDCFICSSNLIWVGPACLIQCSWTVVRLNYLSRADDTDAACTEVYLLGLPSQPFLAEVVPNHAYARSQQSPFMTSLFHPSMTGYDIRERKTTHPQWQKNFDPLGGKKYTFMCLHIPLKLCVISYNIYFTTHNLLSRRLNRNALK